MSPLNYKSALTSDVWKNHWWLFSNWSSFPTACANVTRDTQHKGNLCLANSLIYCAHWSSIKYISATLSLSKIIQTVTLKLTLTQCNLGSYKTEYIGVYEGQNIKYFGYCLVFNHEIHQKVWIYVYLQFKNEFSSESPFNDKLMIVLLSCFLLKIAIIVDMFKCCLIAILWR